MEFTLALRACGIASGAENLGKGWAMAIETPGGDQGITKSPTGITGLDQVTGGGLPAGRITLLVGGPGCGKTLLAMEFLVRGVTDYGEPGVFIAFEETEQELRENVATLGFDLDHLIEEGGMHIDHVSIDRSEFEETGEFDLEGLFIRLGYAIDKVSARRVAIDTIETLFAGLPNEAIVRSEIRRLFRWLRDRGVTCVVTGERGSTTITRYGLEEYVSDCVIALDHRVTEQVSTRRMRIVKYRGTGHGTNEYPFIIGGRGISVLPITSMKLEHEALTERVSTGVGQLDTMLGGEGYFRGSTVLVSGTAGTGKTSLAAAFVNAACARAERALFFAFEESPAQLLRNMLSIGIDLQQWVDSGQLRVIANRPQTYGIETHLVDMHREIDDFQPRVIAIDPATSFTSLGDFFQVTAMVSRLIDYFKSKGITALFTNLTPGAAAVETTEAGVSSLMDTWVLTAVEESNGERKRKISIVKSRGMEHSNRIHDFLMSERGILISERAPSGEETR